MSLIKHTQFLYRKFHQRYSLRQGHRLYLLLFVLRSWFLDSMYVDLNHGLANRLGTLVSCLVASETLNKNFNFIWHNNRLCGCNFEDLFENDLSLVAPKRIVDFNDDTTCKPAFLTRCKTFMYSRTGYDVYEKCSDGRWDLHNIPFITGECDFAAQEFSRVLNMLKPVSEVLEMVPAIPGNTIGVHIRRTDLPWQNRSSMDLFEQRMKSVANQTEKLYFYVATDDNNVKEQLKSRFGSNIISLNVVEERQSVLGMRMALADLLTLSKTKMILGTFNSSFSWLASMWNLTNYEIVESITNVEE